MNEIKAHDIWVYLESGRHGMPDSTGLELLGEGRKLADSKGCSLAGIMIGYENEEGIHEARMYGADYIIVIEGREFERYTTDAYTSALHYLVKKYDPDVLMIGATADGRDLAPRLAARLRTGLTADCTGIGYDSKTGCVEWTRPAFSGNLLATIVCPERRPQMGTVRRGVFQKKRSEEKLSEVIREDFHFASSGIRTEILEILRDAGEDGCDLENADIIVSGGKGVKDAAGFRLIRELADELGGSVGASRAAVDEGMISRAHQVGQTGKTVSPRLYIACGISGAIQHQAGMNKAETIIAINSDPDAPIFRIADYGIAGDLFEVIPVLIEEIRKLKEHS